MNHQENCEFDAEAGGHTGSASWACSASAEGHTETASWAIDDEAKGQTETAASAIGTATPTLSSRLIASSDFQKAVILGERR